MDVQYGLLSPSHDSSIQLSPFGVIPKKNKPNKWHLIVDLSSPKGRSVNDAISKELCSIAYVSLDDAVAWIQSLGRGCMLAKLDLREAYRAVPFHPSDQHLLGVQWRDTYFIDRVLPFGLQSAPKIFSALADAMMWVLHERGVQHALHYIDDFLLLGPPASQACQSALLTTLTTCQDLGFPAAPDKTEGPSTTLVFLGIEIDTVAGQLRLPQDKLRLLLSTLSQLMKFRGRQVPRISGKKRDLLSLIGCLNHTAMVVRPGRPFLRNFIDATTFVKELDHWVHLNQAARAYIAWWHAFIQIWNGVSLLPCSCPPKIIISDASGSWGCGATYLNLWFQLQWPQHWAVVTIAPKELVPIVIRVALWGSHWSGSRVCCLCDNAAVVAAVNKGSARDPSLVRLLHILAFLCAVFDITVTAKHLPGVQNVVADALSCNNLKLFFAFNPQASPVPAVIPSELVELTLTQSLRWTSPTWMGLFSASLAATLRLPPVQPTNHPSAYTTHSAHCLELNNHTP